MVYTVIGSGDFGWTSAPISYNANVNTPRGLCIDPVSQRLFVSGANSLSFAEVYTLTTNGFAGGVNIQDGNRHAQRTVERLASSLAVVTAHLGLVTARLQL
jgi:hypothetical protein